MIIQRYINLRVAKSALGIFVMILLSVLLVQLLGRFDQVVAGRMPLSVALQLVWLQLPFLTSLLLPFSLFFGIVLVFGQMHFDQEMIILEMTGFTVLVQLRRLWLSLLLVSLPVAYCSLLSQVEASRAAQHLLQRSSLSSFLDTVQPGRFQSANGHHAVFYAESVEQHHKVFQRIFMARKLGKSADFGHYGLLSAKSARRVWRDDLKVPGEFLEFHNGVYAQGQPGSGAYKRIKFDVLGLRLSNLAQTETLEDKMAYQSVQSLWARRGNVQAAIELGWRMVFPIAIWVLALIAVPLSRIGPRQDRFARVLPALMIFTVYMNLLFVNHGWLMRGKIPHALGFWWVHGCALGVSFFWVCSESLRSRWQRLRLRGGA